MPLYEFECATCGTRFDELVRVDEVPACPKCGASNARRLYSGVSRPAKFGLRGLEAERSNANRRLREERRREQRAQRRDRETRG